MGFHHRFQAVVEVGHILLLIVERDYDGILWHGLLIIDEKQFSVPCSQFSVGYLWPAKGCAFRLAVACSGLWCCRVMILAPLKL